MLAKTRKQTRWYNKEIMSIREFVLICRNSKSINTIQKNLVLLKINNTYRNNKIKKKPNVSRDHQDSWNLHTNKKYNKKPCKIRMKITSSQKLQEVKTQSSNGMIRSSTLKARLMKNITNKKTTVNQSRQNHLLN